MPSPGLYTQGINEWPRFQPSRRPALIDSRRAFPSFDNTHDSGLTPGIHQNSNYYADDGHSPGPYSDEGASLSRQGHSSSHRPSFEQLPVESHRESQTRDNREDLDKQRNRESCFRHPAIDFGRRQIRLVRVLPTEPGTPIKCKFALSMVDNRSVRYTALSYTWGQAGSASDIKKIILHKQDFWIRRNLWCFLRQVRDDSALCANWYWIDALCIDQAENGKDGQQEKNHQVNMMSRIYSNAHRVMTWLGEPARRDHAALYALRDCIDGSPFERDEKSVRDGLRYLGDSPYWSRIWIMQEIVLAKKVKFRVGRYDFDWKPIYSLRLEASKPSSRYAHDMGWAMKNILDLRQHWYKGPSLDLRDGIRNFRSQKCSDPRDKIYGLLGLMEHKPCVPDYSKSCKDLYVEIVLWSLRQGVINKPSHDVDTHVAVTQRGGCFTFSDCIQLRLWSTLLQLSSSDRFDAQRQLADELNDGWPHTYPWNCQ